MKEKSKSAFLDTSSTNIGLIFLSCARRVSASHGTLESWNLFSLSNRRRLLIASLGKCAAFFFFFRKPIAPQI
jgi:hypothetical protein